MSPPSLNLPAPPGSAPTASAGGLALLGQAMRVRWGETRITLDFLGQVILASGRLLTGRSALRRSDLLRQIESSNDDVSQRVAQAACDSDTSGSDHAVDDEDGSDSEVSMRCKFVDSMAAESRSVQSDEGATSADSDACATD